MSTPHKQHHYQLKTTWTGNTGEGTKNYRGYKRHHTIAVDGKPDILGSAMPLYMGDADRHNPEDTLMAAISACHMLWYLHLCASAGVVVTAYEDNAEGVMIENEDGSGRFTQVTLKPVVTVTLAAMVDKANALHADANRFCFVANSLNFPVHHQPVCKIG
jgi:organic hydroperoxide reductase OsmC/OhrA